MVDVAKLREMLKQGVVHVRFMKKDGSERLMRATLDTARFSYEHKGTGAKRSDEVTTMWDVDAGAWRSMRNENLLGWVGGVN